MFEEFSPGYYSKYYGQLLSEAAHGMAHKMIMRTYGELEQGGGNRVVGNWYNEKAAITVINALAAVVSGYFNYVDIFLPRNQLKARTGGFGSILGDLRISAQPCSYHSNRLRNRAERPI